MCVPKPTVALLTLLAAGTASAIKDQNQNGMSDLWEEAVNQGQPFSPDNSLHHPVADPDGDGWTNEEEAIAGTHPFVADAPRRAARFLAHGEAIDPIRTLLWPSVEGKVYQLSVTSDLDEWSEHGDPVAGTGTSLEFELPSTTGKSGLLVRVGVCDEDPDEDGLSSWEELQIGTNRMLADSDHDGLADGLELSANTDPLGHAEVTDSDEDGLLDFEDAVAGDSLIDWRKAGSIQYVMVDLGDEVAGWTPVGLSDDYDILFNEGVWTKGEVVPHEFPGTSGTVTVQEGDEGEFTAQPYEASGTRGYAISPDGGAILADARAWATEGLWFDERINWNTVSVFGTDLEESWDPSVGYGFEPGNSAAFWPVGVSGTGVFTIRKDPFGDDDPPASIEVFPLEGGAATGRPLPFNYRPVATSDPQHGDVTASGWLACNLSRVSAGEGGSQWRLGLWSPQGELASLPPEADGWKWPVNLADLPDGKVGLVAGNQDYVGEVFLQAPDGSFRLSSHFEDANIQLFGGNGTAMGADHRLWVNGEWIGTEVWCPQLGDLLDSGWYSRAVDSNQGGAYLVRTFNGDQTVESAKLLVPAGFVPDYNRDGKIDFADRGKVTRENPWRWWINDDNDKNTAPGNERGKNADDVPGGPEEFDLYWVGDNDNDFVDGMRDLIDFFPLHLSLEEMVGVYPLSAYDYLLVQADRAVRFYEYPACVIDGSDSSHFPNRHIKSVGVARGLSGKNLERASAEGVELGSSLLESCEKGKGVLVLEGVRPTLDPILVEVSRKSDGARVAVIEFPLSLSRVEEMYRHVNMRDVTGGGGGHITQTGEPVGYPDSLTNGKYVAYFHGFKVSGESSRGSQANIFKRLHQMGNRARFIGVSWHGDPPNPGAVSRLPDYHRAVYNGLTTGIVAKTRLGFTQESSLAVLAHSLGNSVVGNAIVNFGLKVDQYYMINGAIPIEAYDSEQTSNSSGHPDMKRNMTEDDWKPFYDHGSGEQRRLFAANWHQLFSENPDDNRNKLTWKELFAAPDLISVLYNFYSPSDEVVENPDETEEIGDIDNIWNSAVLKRHAWVSQEIGKGGQNGVALALLDDLNGGWEFNGEWDISLPEGYGDRTRRRTPSEAAWITDAELKSKPFHRPFLFSELYDPDRGSGAAGLTDNRYRLLGTGIPATSYAVAANRLDKLGNVANFNMPSELMSSGGSASWPQHEDALVPNEWRHSDFKDVAIQFLYPMYEKMIELGNLDQD